MFKNLRIENEEDFKKAVEKIPDFKVKAEKVHIYLFRCFTLPCFDSFISSKVANSMLFLNNSLANSVLNNKNFLIIPTKLLPFRLMILRSSSGY